MGTVILLSAVLGIWDLDGTFLAHFSQMDDADIASLTVK